MTTKTPTRLTIGSLFSGIGGLELGVERATGGRTVWNCEQNAYCRAVLKRHWPNAIQYEDVHLLDQDTPKVDILCGGFPCQDLSRAATWTKLSERKGLDGKRSGLWSEYVRTIRLLRPDFVFVENVPALVNLGLERVLGDLAELGFDAEWDCFSHLDVGGWTNRARFFLLAYPYCLRREDVLQQTRFKPDEERKNQGLRGQGDHENRPDWGGGWMAHARGESEPVALLRGADARVSTFVDRTQSLGNCVVPQVAERAWKVLYERAMRP